jgi:hypothetical protein
MKETVMRFRFGFVALLCLLLPWVPLIAVAQSGRLALPDFAGLSKKASQSVNISLDPALLELAAGVLSADSNPNDAAVKDLIKGLQGVYVRSYRFDHDGAYSQADVDAVRAQLAAPGWTPLVSTHDRAQRSDVDIFIRRSGQRTEGMAIIASQPRALTIVNIVGPIDLAKLAQLQGRFGVPRIDVSSLLGSAAGESAPSSAVSGIPAPAEVARAAAADPQMGTWQTHQVTFQHLRDLHGPIYSCQGLRDALAFLLSQSGAKVNAPIQVYPCGSTPLTVKINFSTFTPGAPGSGSGDPALPGSWRRVLFSGPHSFPQLHDDDCQLVSEFKANILTLIATRDVSATLPCNPNQGNRFELSFRSFVPSDAPRRTVGGG